MEGAAALELALAVEFGGVEGVNAAVAEVADEQVVAEAPEVDGCQGQPPGRVELALGSDAADQVTGGVEGVHEAVTLARHIVVPVRVLQRVGHVDGAAEVLDPERRVACGEVGVGKRAAWHGDGVKAAVEHVDGACVEVRGVQEVAGRRARDREPLVHRPARRVVHDADHGNTPKSRDGAVLAREDEAGGARACTVVHDKAGAAVPHEAGRRALLAPRTWNRDDQGDGAGTDVVERGAARPIVGDPPRRRRAGNQPPGVDQVGIDEGRRHGPVGDEVALGVKLGGGGTSEHEHQDQRQPRRPHEGAPAHNGLLSLSV